MSKNMIRAIRGMNDIVPPTGGAWIALESTVTELLSAYGYHHMRLPLLEFTDLFKRSIGDATDIVEKEMYTFDDRNGESLTLRPEATAGLVRAAISNGMTHNQRHKVWTSGPMFRYEKPQKGRYRQFHQIDVEAFGFDGPDIDIEMIAMSARLWSMLGLKRLTLQINSLGTPEARADYRDLLVQYFSAHKDQLDEDSLRRLDVNPMRILDSKNPAMAELIAGAPLLNEHLDTASAAHFEALQAGLDALGIDYEVNPRLVRGLDYYSRTVFEWVTDALGAQGAVCSGGRYDGLFEQLGGKSIPAIGWAIGVERLLALCEAEQVPPAAVEPHVYLVAVGAQAERDGLTLSERLRDALPGLRLDRNLGGGGMKAQLKRADKSGAQLAVIIGEQEAGEGVVAVKPLRESGEQQRVAYDGLADWLAARVSNAAE
ncbi:MAG: histidine--tRNA ligase [Pseudomonadota bacterium]